MRGDRLAATAGPADPIGVGFEVRRVGSLLHLPQPEADGRLRESGGQGDGCDAAPTGLPGLDGGPGPPLPLVQEGSERLVLPPERFHEGRVRHGDNSREGRGRPASR